MANHPITIFVKERLSEEEVVVINSTDNSQLLTDNY